MDFASEGEIFDIISNTGAFSEETARYYFIQIIAALNYMQNTAGICHRDLKPENILIDKELNNSVKVIDFGTSVFY